MSDSTPQSSDSATEIEAIKAAIRADISEATWRKIRQLGELKIEIVAAQNAAAAPKPKRKVLAEEPRHISDDEWHAMHP